MDLHIAALVTLPGPRLTFLMHNLVMGKLIKNCPFSEYKFNSFDFAVNEFLTILFKSNNMYIIDKFRDFFGVL